MIPQNDAILRGQLWRDEGRELVAYKDDAMPPNWTIGVGHLLGSAPRMSSITERECEALYAADVTDAYDAALRAIPEAAGLDGPRLRAIINMTFNRGEGGVRHSTTITPAIQRALGGAGSWSDVAEAVRASPWGKDIKARGERLAVAFESGADT